MTTKKDILQALMEVKSEVGTFKDFWKENKAYHYIDAEWKTHMAKLVVAINNLTYIVGKTKDLTASVDNLCHIVRQMNKPKPAKNRRVVWSEVEDNVLVGMMARGESYETIGKFLNRTPNAVQTRWHKYLKPRKAE